MSATTLPSRRRFTPERIGTAIGVVATSVVAIVALGRFVHPDNRPGPVAVSAAPVTLAGSIATYEARTLQTPNDPAAWSTLAELYVRQAAASGDPTFYGLAGSAIDHAEGLAPNAASTLIAHGGLALAVHDFATAHALALKGVAAAPYKAEAYAVLIDSSVELGRYDEAAQAVQQLLDLKPDSAALARTSYLRELNGQTASALDAMRAAEQAALAAPSERAVLAGFVGDLELAAGDLDAAQASYDRALTAFPKLLSAELGLARLSVARGDLDDAAARLHTLVQRSPQPVVATLLADVETRRGHDKAALDAVALVRASDQLLAAAGVTIDLESAIFEADHDDQAAALKYATAAYAARHTVFTADAMGWALTRSGRAAEAIPYVSESLALGTQTASLRVHAAVAFHGSGDDTSARRELAAAFARSPWFALSVQADAIALADQLDVSVPDSWRQS